ncbi:MAG TPA: multidrug effflux MFS transporter [Microvirga sp.]|jgi:DHA1 family bicyclomycin/chloramphenicol resistance-like MFS transporter|nr:multidrug effflux MFS transporter [Microvirga sp.]
MDTSPHSGAPARTRLPRFAEFVALVALMMAVTAVAIDIMLPAFPAIQAHYGVAETNELQLLVYVYMIGFALMQLVYGPVSDIVGRRPALLVGMGLFAVGCVLSLLAPSFSVLMVARLIQGMGAAAGRVLAIAIVRDCFAGREMARVMSITFAVFIIVPVFAPAMGSLLLLFGSWHLVFATMLISAVILVAWFWLRMPETLHPEYRFPFSAARIAEGVRLTLASRAAMGYSTGVAALFGAIIGYVGSSQQIFETEVYALGPLFPVAFGIIAGVMGVASVVNAALVRRLGMRRLSHASTLGFVAVGALQWAAAAFYDGRPPLAVFGLGLAASHFLAAIAMSNFNAMAMEPLGAVAGTASSVLGFYTTLAGALLGLLIGQAFDATVLPLTFGYFALGAVCLVAVLWAEGGVLFRPHNPDPAR